MVQSRIREIRKEKGLTLQEVAERAGTTAQTIGRLETGARTLSLKWVNKISKALGVESASLLTLPEKGDIEILGALEPSGRVLEKNDGIFSPRLLAQDPVAVRAKANLGEYREGDILVFETGAKDLRLTLAKECLIRLKGGDVVFGLVIGLNSKAEVTYASRGKTGGVKENAKVEFVAPLVALVRRFP